MKNTLGYHYAYADGTEVWSREPMTVEELTEHKAYVDANSAYMEAHSDDYEPYYTLGEPRVLII
jgi:hypothetical protein